MKDFNDERAGGEWVTQCVGGRRWEDVSFKALRRENYKKGGERVRWE